ncbi:MAG: hypothetical protein M5T61_12850 [Acidimicrobiia bacterium]|nr:hypothetical protein [Acidimicrobiia bacterium]
MCHDLDMVHPVAAAGFGPQAGLYESTRPTYPAAAMEWIAARLPLGPGALVVDLAAGTGKLTRLLLAGGASVVAVEPVGGMRDALRESIPQVPVVSGLAEALPVRRGHLRHGPSRSGVPLVRLGGDRRRACARGATRWGRRVDLERPGPVIRVGRPGVVGHGPGREARALA